MEKIQVDRENYEDYHGKVKREEKARTVAIDNGWNIGAKVDI
jgi:hypothetical protein